jgi:DNA-binding response OmpR family regulator
MDDSAETLQFGTVLVCDDDEGVRKLVVDVLTLRTYTVLQAANGADALRVAREHRGPIHLLVTDLVMPGMSGTELAVALHALEPNLKVLYMSGYTDDVHVLSGTLEQSARFLSKPFLPGELVRVIRSLMAKASA